MKKLIHINRNIIQYNAKHGTNLPVCRVVECECGRNITPQNLKRHKEKCDALRIN